MVTPEQDYGVIVNCLSATLYKKPRTDSEIVCDIQALSSVYVNKKKSIDVFYYVSLPDGSSGYCKKEFIAIRR
jgi:hypothetical protein